MTPSEFKAWFDGFAEALDGVPSKDQWTRIKARVAEIDGRPVTERVYVDRYVNHYWPHLVQRSWEIPMPHHTVYCASGTAGTSCEEVSAIAANTYFAAKTEFNGHQAMAALGRAEAASLS